MIMLLFIPESPHWFILNGKREDLLASMKEAAGYNGSDLTNPEMEELVPLPKPVDRERTRKRLKLSLWSPQLRRPTLSLVFSWMSMGIIYYGNPCTLISISLIIRSFQGSIFLLRTLLRCLTTC